MKIIDILRNNKLQLSAEIFPPKFASQLSNARKVVGEIGALNPSYISVTYGAGGNTVGESLALTEEIGARGIPALAHLTCVNADREQIKDVLSKFRQAGVENILTLRGDLFDGAVLKDFQ
ncbi:MAG: methylenetetrahydrofolate reductase, partial [Acidaminococcaceae bacterium]|nr:methylenetetrahydrofolate reductase [Acidaminococcaceae bacterium]